MPDPRETEVISVGPGDARVRARLDLCWAEGGAGVHVRCGTPREIAAPFRFRYEPLPDITVHELARIVEFLIVWASRPHLAGREAWEALGEAKRHLPEGRGAV